MADNEPKPAARTKSVAKKSAGGESSAPSANTAEAKTRFNSALDEARAGVAALGAEARDRASDYGSVAKTKGNDYADQVKVKAGELAVEGKSRATEAISSLAKLVNENATTIDEKLGRQYGDYARSASSSLSSAATRLDNKSVEQIGADAREFVRKSPGTAVALAGLAGYLLSRLLRGK